MLSATTAVQGDVVNLTLTQPAEVVLDDCMYFTNTLTSAENLSEGVYSIKITHSCSGERFIHVKTAEGTEELRIIVEKDTNPEVAAMDKEILELKRNLTKLQNKLHYYEVLTNTLNSMNVELYEKIRTYAEKNRELENELEKAKMMAQNCSGYVKDLEQRLEMANSSLAELVKENEGLKTRLNEINESLSSANQLSEIFKVLFFTTLAFLVGTYFSLLRR